MITPPDLPFDPQQVRDRLIGMQRIMRDAIQADLHKYGVEQLSRVAHESQDDTIYVIDRDVEAILLDQCATWGREHPFILIAEGAGGDQGRVVFPSGCSAEEAAFQLIVDPIDGTRGIMYDKRSAWILAGVAPNRGSQTTLADIVVAVQTELPTTRQYLADTLWAIQGQGVGAWRENLLTGEREPFVPRPSRAKTLNHGFAMLSKFFPGRKPVVAEIEERLLEATGALDDPDKVRVFDDQYISTGGQLYELAIGHDRFNGDVRARLRWAHHLGGRPPGVAVHPYDLCTELIAREAGVIVTDLDGAPLTAPLSVDVDVSWLGYANEELHRHLEPLLQALFREYGLL
ncbi:MAG TPA: inositol monophosphatase [Anaerolineae bacterium]|nr:inositol monophosphatase [Anaerolineae bacterium]HIQ06375.1 inositol monophosphatase [Anaerolineae bacterium]